MRILGLDYGLKNVGVAVSDETATFAFPKDIFKNDEKIFTKIARIIEEDGISKIVVGDPGQNTISDQVKNFVKKIEENFKLPVFLEKEFMTSSHVSQAMGKKPVARLTKNEKSIKRDDSAAALILQRFLDRK